MWVLFQPILFGLTGALVDVQMMDGKHKAILFTRANALSMFNQRF